MTTKRVKPLFPTQSTHKPSIGEFVPISVMEMKENNISMEQYSPRVVQLLQSVSNPLAVLAYGQNEMSEIADRADAALRQIDDTKVDFITDQLSSVLKLVQHNKQSDNEDSSIFARVKKAVVGVYIDNKEDALAHINTTTQQLDRIVVEIENNVEHIRNKIVQLNDLYTDNLDTYHQLTDLIDDAKVVLKIKQNEYNELIKNNNMTPLEAESAQMLKQQIDRFDKRIMTLEQRQFMAMHTAPSIRNIQDSGYTLLDKFHDIKTITIPMWKSVARLYSDASSINKAATFANKLDDTNNELIAANSTKQRETTLKAAQLGQRGIVDAKTLEQVNKDLIDTFTGVLTINKKGQEERDRVRSLMLTMNDRYLETIKK